MVEQEFKRKLTAILSADVEGYSLLMRDDEEATIRTLTTYRKAITSLIQQYRGRLIDATGDNFLSEFTSVVDAVNCAVEIQRELAERNAELPENRRMQFRIGINLGDVVEEEGRIYGDGVNIAARMEGLAEGGGVCISGTVYDAIENKIGLEYEYLGEQEVKNISKPIRAYRVLSYPGAAAHRVIKAKRAVGKTWRNISLAVAIVLVVGVTVVIWNFYLRPAPSVEVASVERMAYPLPDKPSIAVLPFVNMSDDPKQEYFSDGLTEQIISNLSKIPYLFVIARNSTFTYKGKAVKVQKVAEDLGVKYVLEGGVQKTPGRVRITAQLIDAITGHHLWSERYDRELEDIFAMQDEITMKIMTALRVKLTSGEQARVYGRGTSNLEAYLKVMKGYEHVMRFTKDNVHLGRQLYKEAIALDPNYSNAYTLLAWTHRHDVSFGWTKTPEKSIKRGIELVKKALSINEYDALAHMCLSNIYSMMREHEKAIAEGEKGIALEPNGAVVNACFALVLIYAGRYDQAIEKLEKAERLNPISPGWYFWLKTVAFQFAGKYEKAIESAKKGLKKLPNNTSILRSLAASYILLGHMEEASAVTEKILELQPKFSLDQETKILEHKFKNKADVERHIDALRKAGLPDTPPLPLPDKPSIAVLPFVNMSEDPKQEYFSDGITEDIITALSKISDMFVIARNSSFTFKGKAVNVKQVGRDLGVKYVLEGSVRRAGKKVRITAQLIDSTTGNHLWAERYDRELKDIFALQDEITMKILTALRVELTDGEQIRSQATKTENLDAYLKVLQGRDYYWRYNEEGNTLARKMAVEAISLDPTYPRAYALLAGTNMMDVWFRWSKSPRDSLKKGIELLEKAIALDPSYARGHGFLSHFYTLARQYDKAIVEGEKAISIDPNSADSYFFLGMALNFVERPDEAIPLLEKAIRLNPMPPTNYLHNLGVSYRMTERYDEAIKVYKKALKRSPTSLFAHLGLTITYSLSGHEDEARDQAKEVLKVNPKFSVDSLAKTLPYKNQATNDRFIEALRKAGLK